MEAQMQAQRRSNYGFSPVSNVHCLATILHGQKWVLLCSFAILCTAGAGGHGQPDSLGFRICEEAVGSAVPGLSPFVGF